MEIGFRSVGKNLLLSKDAKFYNPSGISLGSDIRIDDFCILSSGEGGIRIGNFVHIACFTSLIGRSSIKIGSFSNLSSKVSVYSSSDDYSGETMTNPLVPEEFKNVKSLPVNIKEHVIVGCNSTILPGVCLNEGVAIGAHSLVKSACKPFALYAGVPAKFIKKRKEKMVELSRLIAK